MPPCAQGGDLGRVLVDADDLMAEFRQAGAGNQADIARADHRDAHENFPKSGAFLARKWPQDSRTC